MKSPRCTCDNKCATLAEMKAKHGTPSELRSALFRAVPEFISIDEAIRGADKYEREWVAMAAYEAARDGAQS